jgi:SAM-dependent methyltransferase
MLFGGLMTFTELLRKLRGRITGFKAVTAHFNFVQMPNERCKSPNDSKSQNKFDGVGFQSNIAPTGEKIRLVFLVVTPELWGSFEPIWKRAKQDDRFLISVVLLKSSDPGVALISQFKARALFENAGISYFTEQNFCLDSYRPHVIFYPLPYSCLYPESYKPEIVASKGYRIAYVPYGLEVGGGLFNARYQYDTEVPRVAWRIFARSRTQLVSFGRHCSRGNGHVVVTGHPRSELSDSCNVPAHWAVKSKARGRSVILWTPHFTVQGRRKWSSFLDHHKTILKLIDDRPELFLLVRPHPFLRIKLAKLEDWDAERVNEWFNALDDRDNVHVDTETDYRPAFEASSALMADAGSFMVEYLRTGKPVCHLTGKGDIGLNEEARSLACFYPGATESHIADFLDRLQSHDDPLYGARQDALHAYFGPDSQTPSQTILDEIANSISELPRRCHYGRLLAPRLREAFRYWMKASYTFLAPETYYKEQEKILRDILDRHGQGQFAIDIGCGNGRFTELFSDYFEFTEASDPRKQLICKARENAILKGIANIAYTVERLENVRSLSSYDFVSCMGVTSRLIDDDVFLKAIWKLKAAMRPGAKLLVKETLSLSVPELIVWIGYTAVYRNITAYIGAFEATGLTLVEEQIIVQDDEKSRTNRFFVFEAIM